MNKTKTTTNCNDNHIKTNIFYILYLSAILEILQKLPDRLSYLFPLSHLFKYSTQQGLNQLTNYTRRNRFVGKSHSLWNQIRILIKMNQIWIWISKLTQQIKTITNIKITKLNNSKTTMFDFVSMFDVSTDRTN